MRINPVSYSTINRNFAPKNNQTKFANSSPSFTSVLSNATPANQPQYYAFIKASKDFEQIKTHSTRMFRELATELAMVNLLDSNKKTQINVLGCSDGSEAYAYAIALKENWGSKAKKNASVKGVDLAPYMIELAKTGKTACADIEKLYANSTPDIKSVSSPLKRGGWDRYLTKTTAPKSFLKTKRQYPFLRFLEQDPPGGLSLGKGINWYEINKEGLPSVTFEVGDMMNHTSSTEGVDVEVYVIANSGGYLLQENPDSLMYFFNNVKNANRDNNKDIYVVMGDLENTVLNTKVGSMVGISPQKQSEIKNMIDCMGFSHVSEETLRQRGILQYEVAARNIYKLER